MWVKVFTRALGWPNVHKKCQLVPNGTSLDAEILGCTVMIGSLGSGSTSVSDDVCSPLPGAFS